MACGRTSTAIERVDVVVYVQVKVWIDGLIIARQCSNNNRIASEDSSKRLSRYVTQKLKAAEQRTGREGGRGWYVLGREETSKPRIKHASERRWGA